MTKPKLQPIYVVCGVPGSGKSWVCSQLGDGFEYVPHDYYMYEPAKYSGVLLERAREGDKPIVGEAPFAAPVLFAKLRERGATVKPYYVIEDHKITRQRYEKREKKTIPGQHITNIANMKLQAKKYNAPTGTSEQVLKMLKEVVK